MPGYKFLKLLFEVTEYLKIIFLINFNNIKSYYLGNDEFLEERLAMATTFQSPYLKLINRE